MTTESVDTSRLAENTSAIGVFDSTVSSSAGDATKNASRLSVSWAVTSSSPTCASRNPSRARAPMIQNPAAIPAMPPPARGLRR
ncbi:hypothetical protein [Arsenicicoccus piscis]|uniref:hypothetical protein n=1 Tax=Arsenicicoccus piscis TaxID=673954 RepID=UPI0024E138B6|nr:hypothetical protein [Arsenicicoccus piscis]